MFLSVYYIAVYKKHYEQPTRLKFVGITRMLFTIFAYFNIGFMPFIGVMLNPTLVTNGWTNFYTIIYVFFLIVGVFASIGDIFYYIPMLFMRWSGLNKDDEEVNKMYNKLKDFSDNMMWGKKHGRR